MFTGLVADIGTIESVERGDEGARLRVRSALAGEIAPGDSVAVDGACLTAVSVGGDGFEVDAMNQTLERTSLGLLEPGRRVNLELAVRPVDRLGGHLVQGHVDATGTVVAIREDGFARRLEISAPRKLLGVLVERGSVAVDGVSLTIAGLGDATFDVSLVPETLERTTLAEHDEGRTVNLEADVIARYVERLLSTFRGQDDPKGANR